MIVKSVPVRVIFTWKSVPKESIHGSSDIYLGTNRKQWHDSPWSYRSDVIVTFLCYGTIGIIWHCDHQSTAKKVQLTLIAIVYVLYFSTSTSGPQFKIKMTSFQYRKSHCGDKTIFQPSYLHSGISYTGKTTSLYWIGALHPVDSCLQARWTWSVLPK